MKIAGPARYQSFFDSTRNWRKKSFNPLIGDSELLSIEVGDTNLLATTYGSREMEKRGERERRGREKKGRREKRERERVCVCVSVSVSVRERRWESVREGVLFFIFLFVFYFFQIPENKNN